VDHAADCFQIRDCLVCGDLQARDAGREVVRHLDLRHLRGRADDRDAGRGGAAAVGREQLDGPIGGSFANGRVDAALVALAGLGADLVPLAGAEHRDRIPVGSLDHDLGRVVVEFGGLPTHHAAEADQAGVVGDDQVLGRQGAVGTVQGRQALAVAGAAYDQRPLKAVAVVAVDRPTGLQHHVVGDIDRQRDRPHPGRGDPLGDEVRRRGGRVEAGDGARHEHVAPVRVLDHDRVAVLVGRGCVTQRRVTEVGRTLDRHGDLSRDAAQRECVRPVGVDLELDDLLVESQHPTRVLARLARAFGEHDDPVVILADAEFARRADHARGEVAVRLARADLEVPRKYAAGQDAHDQIAGLEVVRTADDPLRFAGAVGIPDVHGAPVDRLAVLLRLGLHREHAADDERALDLGAGAVDGLQLETGQSQAVSEVVGRDVGRNVDVLLDPGKWRQHGSDLRSECGREADVALEERAQVLKVVPEHE
jgi:hypothetical protein